MAKKGWVYPLVVGLLSLIVCFFYWRLLLPSFLTFSDAAKFADLARNIVLGNGYGASFTLFDTRIINTFSGQLLLTSIPPLFPFLMSIVFRVFGITDSAVILTSLLFYLFSALAIYFLGKVIFGELVGGLAALAFIFDPAMLNYATSGASESLFIFELILAALFFYSKRKTSSLLGFLVLLLSYFTRPSAIIYIIIFIVFWALITFKQKKNILMVIGVTILSWFLLEIMLTKLSGRFFLYSPLSLFLEGITSFSPQTASTTSLRGGGIVLVGLRSFASKVFYDLYNFYKSLPQIFSPYLVGLYFLSLFRWGDEKRKKIFRVAVLLMVLVTFVTAAATLPNYRYLHPVAPFVYLLAVEMLVWILGQIFGQKKKTWILAVCLVMFFIVGQTLGKIFLDSRYLGSHSNLDKPLVYVRLATILRDNTGSSHFIITNLDTWGSWYGERKTMWFPLEPSQLIPGIGEKLKIDAIYLTSYKMDDENYYMGENWRKIFLNPEKIEDKYLSDNFKFAGRFEVKPEETYEREGATAVLLVRNQ